MSQATFKNNRVTSSPQTIPIVNIGRFRTFSGSNMEDSPQISGLDFNTKFETKVVAKVLPFRVNNYVIENLIDWSNPESDPMFRLVFPHREMLEATDFNRVAELVAGNASQGELDHVVGDIRQKLNPNPADQASLNVPVEDGFRLEGLQHKYRETVLVFPAQGQTCHTYCSFCFRWNQFVKNGEEKFKAKTQAFLDYLAKHKEVIDVLFTGGDPLVMNHRRWEGYLLPLLDKKYDHIQNIRIGTKTLAFWPYRFTTDQDADDMLRLFERVVQSGKQLAIMAHYDHPVELSTPAAEEAIRRVRSTGAVIRSQGPVLRNINDNSASWAQLWKKQLTLGIVPYYQFVERDTGARRFFEVPLARAFEIYRESIQQVSGLGRTARGPVMSASQGKVHIQGAAQIGDDKVFVLSFLQSREPDHVGQTFFAKFDENATWFNELEPYPSGSKFFFD